jgi:hypothetical protein
MIRKTMGIALVTSMILVVSSASVWCVPKWVYSSAGTTWEKTKNPDVLNCVSHWRCDYVGDTSTTTAMQIGSQAPQEWTLLSLEVLDTNFQPLQIGGTPVVATQLPCAPGACPVDAIHPAPVGGQWRAFETNDLVTGGPGGLDFIIRVSYDVHGGNPVGRTVSAWLTNDANARYGDEVSEGFMEGPFFFTVPSLKAWSGSILVLLLLATGVTVVRRRRPALH